jgi:hypothetical protein
MSTSPKDPSRLRQALRQSEEERVQHVEALLHERGPLIRGTYKVQGGRCGRANCKCSRGELHTKAVLYRREDGGALRCTYVPLEDRERLERLNGSYRRSSKARTALAKLSRRSLELADALQEALLEPYVPSSKKAEATTGGRPRRRKGGKS